MSLYPFLEDKELGRRIRKKKNPKRAGGPFSTGQAL
jgi:hypothetical protein